MSDIIVSPSLGNVGENPCYQNEQERYVDYMSKTVWAIPLGQLSGVWVSDIAPADDTNVWIKINPSTGGMLIPVPLIYSTGYGQWIGLHPKEAASDERSLWVGSLANLDLHDQGEVGAITDTTGPFWEVDANYADRVPAGVGPNIAAVATDYDIFANAVSGGPVQARGTYIIKRTARIFYRG